MQLRFAGDTDAILHVWRNFTSTIAVKVLICRAHGQSELQGNPVRTL